MECWTGDHWYYVAFGTMGLAVYLLGLPLIITYILLYIRKHMLQTDRFTMVAFGGLYTKYEAHAWWYEILQVCVLRMPMHAHTRALLNAASAQH